MPSRLYAVKKLLDAHYAWTALQAVRERIAALLNEEDKIDGLENVEVKVFK